MLAVSRAAHDREGVHSRLTKPRQHCMAKGVNHKISAKPDNGTGLLVKVIDRGHAIGPPVPVGESSPPKADC